MNEKEVSREILKKEIDAIGTTSKETKDSKDFRIALAISNGSNDYLDPKEVSKSTIGNIYSIWLTTYAQGINMIMPATQSKTIFRIIKDYDFRDDIIGDENIDTTLFEQYINKEITYDEIIQKLLSR